MYEGIISLVVKYGSPYLLGLNSEKAQVGFSHFKMGKAGHLGLSFKMYF